MVVVSDLVEAEVPADVEEGPLCRDQFVLAPAADHDRAAAAVHLGCAARVVLQATEVRQHVFPAPGVVAERRPLVVIRRHAAKRDRGVHGRGAPNHTATRVRNRPARDSLGGKPPVVLTQGHPPAVPKIGRRRLNGCVIGPSLQKDNRPGRILRQPSREDRTSRAATHDDVVVLRGRILLHAGPRRAERRTGARDRRAA